MSPFAKDYGPAAGPLGFPMPDAQARALDALLRGLPRSDEFAYRKAVLARAPTELNPGERSDVSWISAEVVDRQGEVVLARGLDDRQFQANPLVTLNHAYALPPVGRSLWRRVVRDGDRRGVKAKTVYPPRPAGWGADDDWPPDKVFALVRAGLLNGKSIGFLPTKVHAPTEREVEQHGWRGARLVIDEWVLLEYACVFLPANQHALVEAVSKSAVPALPPGLLRALGLDADLFRAPPPRVIPFTPLEEVEKAVCRRLADTDLSPLVRHFLDRARGRV